MKKLLLLVALAAAVLTTTSCGQANSPPERQEKQAGVEEAAKKPPEPPGPSTTGAGDAMSTAEADAAKAAAAEEEITLEQLRTLDGSTPYEERLVLGLLNCQIEKYIADNGEQAWKEWRNRMIDKLEKTPSEDIVSFQEELLKMGYSCTVPEALSYAPQS